MGVGGAGGLRVASVLVTAGGNGTRSPAAALFRSPSEGTARGGPPPQRG